MSDLRDSRSSSEKCDVILESSSKLLERHPNLHPIKQLLFLSHLPLIRILFQNSFRHSLDVNIVRIHLLRSLPHQRFLRYLPIKTIKMLLTKNQEAFTQDFKKCGIKNKSSIKKTFTDLLLVSSSPDPDLKDLASLLWNILWLRREFLLFIVNSIKNIQGIQPLSFRDTFFDFEDFRFCAESAFHEYLTNPSVRECQLRPRFDFSSYHYDRFNLFNRSPEIELSTFHEDDLTEAYARSVYKFSNILQKTQLPEILQMEWLATSRGYSSIKVSSDDINQLKRPAVQPFPLFSTEFSTLRSATMHLIATYDNYPSRKISLSLSDLPKDTSMILSLFNKFKSSQSSMVQSTSDFIFKK